MNGRVSQLRTGIVTARRQTLGLVESIPDHLWTWQPFEGANHVAWTLLHLLVAQDWGPTALGDPQRDHACHDELLARGPLSDRALYPGREEILEALARSQARFLERLDEIDEHDLSRETSGPIAAFAPNLGCVLDAHIWHEGFHAGQIAVIRKALGLPVAFG